MDNQKVMSQPELETSPTNSEPRTHPLLNSLKWLTGLVVPTGIAAAEISHIYTTGKPLAPTQELLAMGADITVFLGLVITTPRDMGKGTARFLNDKIIKPGLARYRS